MNLNNNKLSEHFALEIPCFVNDVADAVVTGSTALAAALSDLRDSRVPEPKHFLTQLGVPTGMDTYLLVGEEDLYPEWLEETKMAWGSVRSTLLAIVEWQIGLAFDRAWLDEPMPTYRIAYPGAHASGSPSPMLA